MKKILLFLSVMLLLPLQACAQEKWREGTHFKVIAEQATEKKEVLEFFSFWCPHCFNFEPLVKTIKTKLADDVEFKKVHVNFMGFTSAAIQDDATKAMMVARELKRSDELNAAIFKYIHVSRSSVSGINDLKNIFVVNGVEPKDFDKMMSSFGVNSRLKMNNKEIQAYRKHVRSVPTFIVNGKYQATFTRDMNQEDMIDLIVYLSNKK
ncbi:thiol:disulfide interchange protein DsbA/DsbL [Paraglaciecola arctica]|uniref:thiol:disulfide interchange protein DsbA/DsbL n=1 Tax=Paraglaciecola arctica TaxID=1128911 RepID=UPI001C07659D|nr:thiol:disulfide interchange protein DsbA/DsbL [Paraglaciecola arctica]MBU3004689.1 thiol:disulfide interchange protein DsbA/DsbL [Paraglaciecola arctica]